MIAIGGGPVGPVHPDDEKLETHTGDENENLLTLPSLTAARLVLMPERAGIRRM